MKIKILTFIANFILGKVIKDDEPRADMFLPMWLLAFSLVLSIIGCTLVIVSIFIFSLWAVIGAALAIVLGIAAESCAFLTDRLVNKINSQLETLYAEQSVK